ncbi:MAG: hypothetical protein U1F35_15135 [Steroidobacteraceae bacterium]
MNATFPLDTTCHAGILAQYDPPFATMSGTGDHGRLVGGEEGNHRRNVLRLGDAPKRYAGNHLMLPFRRDILEDGRFHCAGHHVVDADASRPELARHAAHHADQRRLRRGIVRGALARQRRGARGIDDRPLDAVPDHQAQRFARAIEGAVQIDIEHAVPAFVLHIDGDVGKDRRGLPACHLPAALRHAREKLGKPVPFGAADAGVVHQYVEPAEGLVHRGKQLLHRRAVGDVANLRDTRGITTGLFDRLARSRLLHVHGDHPGALANQAQRYGTPHALAGSGDHGHLVRKSHRTQTDRVAGRCPRPLGREARRLNGLRRPLGLLAI